MESRRLQEPSSSSHPTHRHGSGRCTHPGCSARDLLAYMKPPCVHFHSPSPHTSSSDEDEMESRQLREPSSPSTPPPLTQAPPTRTRWESRRLREPSSPSTPQPPLRRGSRGLDSSESRRARAPPNLLDGGGATVSFARDSQVICICVYIYVFCCKKRRLSILAFVLLLN